MADKMRVGGILFYSICQDYRYTICLASANEMKVNNQHYVGAVKKIKCQYLWVKFNKKGGKMSIKLN